MKYYIIFLSILAILMSCGSKEMKKDNFSKQIDLEVINPVEQQRADEAVVIKLDKIKKKDANFNPQAFIVTSKDIEIPYQLLDHNGDSVPDAVLFLLNMQPKEKIEVKLKYNESGKISHDYPKRTQAEISHKFGGVWKDHKYIGGKFKNVEFTRVPDEHTDHSFFYRYEGPGWESDKVGYRFYLDWRNAIDVYGKKTNNMVLQNVGLDGFESYHEMADWGMDVLKVGNSLGMGSIGMWYNNKVKMVSNVDSSTCKIVVSGPLCSAINTKYFGWDVDHHKYNLDSRLSIKAGSRLTRHDLYINPQVNNLCTGLVKDKNAKQIRPETEDSSGKWTYIAQYGKQSLNKDNLGMAILFKKSDMKLLTEDDLSQIVVLSPKNGKLSYYFLAAWELEPDGIKNFEGFKTYLQQLLIKMNNPVQIIL